MPIARKRELCNIILVLSWLTTQIHHSTQLKSVEELSSIQCGLTYKSFIWLCHTLQLSWNIRDSPEFLEFVPGLETLRKLAQKSASPRSFVVLRKSHTDQHPTLKQSTIISLMAIKFNSEECCFDSKFSSELLTKCKKATIASLNCSTDS